MPKRKQSSLHSHFRAKRSRGRARLAPKNQFAGQLGGWSTYTMRKQKSTVRTFSTRPAEAGGTLQGADTKGQIVITPNVSVPQNILDVFQRIRIKKIEVFIKPDSATSGGVQMSICRSLQDDDSINPLNVPGAAVKFVEVGNADGTADYLRAARFYPPVIVNGDAVPLTKDNWIDTSNGGGASWKCFNWQIASIGSTRPPLTIRYYATITLLCDGLKA